MLETGGRKRDYEKYEISETHREKCEDKFAKFFGKLEILRKSCDLLMLDSGRFRKSVLNVKTNSLFADGKLREKILIVKHSFAAKMSFTTVTHS